MATSEEAVNTACGAGGCGGGGSCGKGAQGDACSYMSQVDAACQKAMTPYTDKCSSCGGSGVQGGGGGGSGGGGGGSSDSGVLPTPEIYTLSYIFDKETEGLPAEGHIRFDSIAQYPVTPETQTVNVSQWGLSPGTQPEYITYRGPLYFKGLNFCTVTKVAFSNVDMNGRDSSIILNTLDEGEIFGIAKNTNSGVFVNFNALKKYLSLDKTCTVITVDFKTSEGEIVDKDIVNIVVMSVVVAGGVDYVACPDCDGTGLEGSTGGIPGLIMAVFNGSAGYAGVTNVDIYGRKI